MAGATRTTYGAVNLFLYDLTQMLGRNLYIWELDYLTIMRLTHSLNWIGVTRNQKYEPNSKVQVGKLGIPEIQWNIVHEDNLLVSPGVYKVDTDKGEKLFVNFIGRRRYEFPLFGEEEARGILTEVFRGNSYISAIETVSHISMKDLDERMWKELQLYES